MVRKPARWRRGTAAAAPAGVQVSLPVEEQDRVRADDRAEDAVDVAGVEQVGVAGEDRLDVGRVGEKDDVAKRAEARAEMRPEAAPVALHELDRAVDPSRGLDGGGRPGAGGEDRGDVAVEDPAAVPRSRAQPERARTGHDSVGSVSAAFRRVRSQRRNGDGGDSTPGWCADRGFMLPCSIRGPLVKVGELHTFVYPSCPCVITHDLQWEVGGTTIHLATEVLPDAGPVSEQGEAVATATTP